MSQLLELSYCCYCSSFWQNQGLLPDASKNAHTRNKVTVQHGQEMLPESIVPKFLASEAMWARELNLPSTSGPRRDAPGPDTAGDVTNGTRRVESPSPRPPLQPAPAGRTSGPRPRAARERSPLPEAAAAFSSLWPRPEQGAEEWGPRREPHPRWD